MFAGVGNRRRSAARLLLLGACAFADVACGSATREPTLPDPDADLGLGNVVMMVWTTRDHEGLLGHALEPVDVYRVDPHRKVVEGEPRWVPTDQTLQVMVTRSVSAEVGAGHGVVSAQAQASSGSHIAYDVRITGYLELPPSSLHYAAASGCCLGGNASSSCGDEYVVRLMRGSGTVQYLQRLQGDVSVEATEILKARGGASFRKLSESTFRDAYFAYELVPLSVLCSRVAPEDEVEVLAVGAPDTCFLNVFHEDGSRESSAFKLPDEHLCREVSQRRCGAVKGALACQATFKPSSAERGVELPLEPRPAVEPVPAEAPPPVRAFQGP